MQERELKELAAALGALWPLCAKARAAGQGPSRTLDFVEIYLRRARALCEAELEISHAAPPRGTVSDRSVG